MRLANDHKLYASDPTPPESYDIRTISRDSSAYANFISAYKKALRTNDCVKVYWNNKNRRTDLSYWINTHITSGRSWDRARNGYYTYLEGSSANSKKNLVQWLDFFRDSYEWFRNLDGWTVDTNGEKRYRLDKNHNLAICVNIPYDPNKYAAQRNTEQEHKAMEYGLDETDKLLDNVINGGSDGKKKQQETGTNNGDDGKTLFYIALGVFCFVLLVKLKRSKK